MNADTVDIVLDNKAVDNNLDILQIDTVAGIEEVEDYHNDYDRMHL